MDLNIDEAIAELQNGCIIGVPTDTIYGLSSLHMFGEKIYQLKKRDKSKKLITMISSIDQLDVNDPILLSKMKEVWPGNVTLIFDYQNEMRSFRIPNEPNLLALLTKLDEPVYTTSANLSGEQPVENREQFKNKFPTIGILKEPIKCSKTSIPSEIYMYENNKFERIR